MIKPLGVHGTKEDYALVFDVDGVMYMVDLEVGYKTYSVGLVMGTPLVKGELDVHGHSLAPWRGYPSRFSTYAESLYPVLLPYLKQIGKIEINNINRHGSSLVSHPMWQTQLLNMCGNSEHGWLFAYLAYAYYFNFKITIDTTRHNYGKIVKCTKRLAHDLFFIYDDRVVAMVRSPLKGSLAYNFMAKKYFWLKGASPRLFVVGAYTRIEMAKSMPYGAAALIDVVTPDMYNVIAYYGEDGKVQVDKVDFNLAYGVE